MVEFNVLLHFNNIGIGLNIGEEHFQKDLPLLSILTEKIPSYLKQIAFM